MNKFVAVTLAFIILAIPYANARVDAEFIIKDSHGRQIYMLTTEREIIFGNVIAGERILFDASSSSSAYKIDKYYWDFDGDGKWDRITTTPETWYAYKKPGTYNATLMAVASSAPPAGDGDVVKHVIKVVKKIEKPVAMFAIKKCENGSYEFNGNKSYDPDGYIKSYRWDFDGDGKWDIASIKPIAYHAYIKNGFYRVKLEVVDYDIMKDETIRVIEIKDKSGEINETTGTINIKNELNDAAKFNITINNYYNYNILIEKGKIGKIENAYLSRGINEIKISYYSNGITAKIILFNFSKNVNKNVNIVINGNGIYIERKSTPGYETYAFLIALLSVILFKKIRGKD